MTISIIIHWIMFILIMVELKKPVTLMRLEEAKNIPDSIKDVYKDVFVKKLNDFETMFFDNLEKGVIYGPNSRSKGGSVPKKVAEQVIANNMKENISNTFCEMSRGTIGSCSSGTSSGSGTKWVSNDTTCEAAWGGDEKNGAKYYFRSPWCKRKGWGRGSGVDPCSDLTWGPLHPLSPSEYPKLVPKKVVSILNSLVPKNKHHLLFGCEEY